MPTDRPLHDPAHAPRSSDRKVRGTQRSASEPLILQPKIGISQVRITSLWSAARTDLAELFGIYPQNTAAGTDLTVRVHPPGHVEAPPPQRGLLTSYGRFYHATWSFLHDVSVSIAVSRSPLRYVRPLIDYEMHGVQHDVGKLIHEAILPTFIQGTQAHHCTFIHGAALATPEGAGVILAGYGGVGKTSLALELGRRLGWRFLSDDLTLLDIRGVVHLNANRPKIYAYNVQGDPELEALLLQDRSLLNRLHWRVKKPWPHTVRRSVLPTELYDHVALSAPLEYLLLIDRTDVDEIVVHRLGRDEAASLNIEILRQELRRVASPLKAHLPVPDQEHALLPTWRHEIWLQTLYTALKRAHLLRVLVPRGMSANEYRHAMGGLLRSGLADL